MSREDTWMTVEMVQRELHFSTADAARKWIRRRNIARVKRSGPDGRTVLVARRDVERVWFGQERTAKHDRASGLAGAHRAPSAAREVVPAAPEISRIDPA